MKKSILLFLLSFYVSGYAQLNLTEEDKREFELRAKQRIDDFLSYLGTIASKSVSAANKDAATASALDLFIGKGYDYTYIDENDSIKKHAAVTMQTTGAGGRKYQPKPMRKYLENLRGLPYTKVTLSSADAIRVDNLVETGDGKYRGVAYFYQNFVGERDNRIVYSSWDKKSITIYVERTEIHVPTGASSSAVQIVWILKLGDVSAVETKVRR